MADIIPFTRNPEVRRMNALMNEVLQARVDVSLTCAKLVSATTASQEELLEMKELIAAFRH
jgi:hypothetical protein